MSLYVVPENQELLWNVINKNLYIQQYFASARPDKQHEWFRSIIRSFYDKNRDKNITVSELDQMNRDTIAHMIQDIRNNNVIVSPSSGPVSMIQTPPIHVENAQSSYDRPVYPPTQQHSIIESIPFRKESKQDAYHQQFQVRQKEYQDMVEKKVPDVPNFGDKVEDAPISNMDDLIQKHLDQRAVDMNQYIPPPSPIETLHIDASSNVSVDEEAVELPPIHELSDRNVSWNNNIEYLDDNRNKSYDDINSMRDEMIVLREQLKLNEDAQLAMKRELSNANEEFARLREQMVSMSDIQKVQSELTALNDKIEQFRVHFAYVQLELSKVNSEESSTIEPISNVDLLKQEMQNNN